MTRRLAPALVLLAACAQPASEEERERAPARTRPNILFVYADDHASHAISAYGSALCTTPNIDRLAAEGMLFERSYCGNSICAPARATVLTGKHSHKNGVIDNSAVFDGSQVTFPKLFQGAGYQTAMIGKWHLKSDPTGFDFWEVLLGQGPYYNPPLKSAAGTVKHEGYTTDVITDRTLRWLEEDRDRERPFLLMYQHKAPHRNWAPGPDHLTKYDAVDVPEPADLFDDWSHRNSGAAASEMSVSNHLSPNDLKLVQPRGLTEEQLARWNAAYGPKNRAFERAGLEGDALTRWQYQRYIKDYLRCIASIDDNLGRVLDYLDETGLAENTIVIYSSDQGFYLGDHGWYDKRWMYEESFGTPLIVRWPGSVRAGSRNRQLVQNIDLAPTLLEIAGLEAPADMQGRSLVPILREGEARDWRRALYYHYYEYPGPHMVPRHYGIATERYKLIHYYELEEWELLDLELDPQELRNLHADPQYGNVKRELELELTRLQALYGDSHPKASREEFYQAGALAQARTVRVENVLRLPAPTPPVESPGDPRNKPLTVGAFVTPQGEGGVIAAQGGESHGYALYLREGRPHFAVREGRRLYEVAGPAALAKDRATHVAGVLTAEGRLRLFVDGHPAGVQEGRILTRTPADGFSVGEDSGSPVGDYDAPFPLEGRIQDLRVYWGALPASALAAWSSGE